jgi:aspartate/methionine/tyrosine aminotransferase
MQNVTSKRIEDVQSPVIPIIGEWISKHPGTISLGQGVVHYPPPQGVHEAVARAMSHRPEVDRYGSVRGIDELLHRISDKVARENGLELHERSVVCTAGSNMGFLNAILAVADIGDEVVLLRPYYFNHEMAIEIAGCRPVVVATDANYQIDVQAVHQALTPRTRAVVTVSPNNPTGAVYSRQALTAVNQLCQQHGCYHISDEAYEYFTYGQATHFSPGSLSSSSSHTISLFTLSKAFGMAGWRCGYMVLPKHLEISVKKIQDTNLICPPVVCQLAALAALESGKAWCSPRIAELDAARRHVLEELAGIGPGCRVPTPDGALYVLIQLDTERNDLELVQTLIRDFRVAVLPGSTFGVSTGCALRIAYGGLPAATVSEGIARLKRGLRQLL